MFLLGWFGFGVFLCLLCLVYFSNGLIEKIVLLILVCRLLSLVNCVGIVVIVSFCGLMLVILFYWIGVDMVVFGIFCIE